MDQRLESILRRAPLFVLLAIVFIASQIIGGETWDERIHTRGADETFAFAKAVLHGERGLNFRDIYYDQEFYGVLPILPMKVASFIGGALHLSWESIFPLRRLAFHLSAFVYAIGAAWAVFRIVELISGQARVAWLAAVALMIYPLWIGYGFFDFKDVPLAFFGALAAYGALLSLTHDDKAYRRGALMVAIAGVGACTIKLAGGIVMVAPAAALLFATWGYGNLGTRWRVLALFGAIAVALVFVMTPAAWLEPIAFVREALMQMAHVPAENCARTAGECIAPVNQNWSAPKYFLLWFLMQAPLLVLALLVPGIVFVMLSGSTKERWLLLFAVAPIAVILLDNSSLYDGLRHVLFLVPLLCAFTVIATIRMVAAAPEPWRRRTSLALRGGFAATLIMFVIDDATMFPYDYVYFNEIGRNFAGVDNFETDYYGFSLREAANIASAQASSDTALVGYTAFPDHLVQQFMRPGLPPVGLEAIPSGAEFLQVRYARLHSAHTPGDQEPYPGCHVVGQVTRQLLFSPAPLLMSYVSRCRKV